MNKFTVFAFINFVIIECVWSQDIRRDENYPPPQLLAKWKPKHDSCVGKTGVSEDIIKQFSDGPIIEDENLKCYMDCMFTEMGVKKADGKVDMVAVHESFNEDKEIHLTFLHMIRLCLYPTGNTDCEIAYAMHKCWKEKDPKHYFLW